MEKKKRTAAPLYGECIPNVSLVIVCLYARPRRRRSRRRRRRRRGPSSGVSAELASNGRGGHMLLALVFDSAA